jgi:signal transduction histidine kinase
MSTLIQHAIGRVRNLASELRPAVLDSLGLSAAIEWETQQFTRRTGIPCTLEIPSDPLELDPDRAIDVFRILQEALTNVVRHAHAHQVDVRLGTWRGQLQLRVADDGRGITDAEITSPLAHGLRSMRERALMWNGAVDIEPLAAHGTAVMLRLPLTDPDRRAT